MTATATAHDAAHSNGKPPTANESLARQFFAELFGTAEDEPGKLVVYWQDEASPKGHPSGIQFFAPADSDKAARYAVSLASEHNVYFGFNLLNAERIRARGAGKRGCEDEVTAVLSLSYDVDAAKPGSEKNYPTRQHILDTLAGMPLLPSAIIGSGSGGVHVYWFLSEPYRINGGDARRYAKALSIAWHSLLKRKLGSDGDGKPYALDSKFTLEAVLRVPGTLRRKPGSTTLVEPIIFEPARRYEPADFEEFLFALPTDDEPIRNVTPEGAERGDVTEQARWRLSQLPPAVSGDGGHNRTFHAACVLVLGFGLSVDEALPLLSEWNERCNPPWTEEELLHKLQDASRRPGARGYLVARHDRGQIANATVERDEEGHEHTTPLTMSEVIAETAKITDDWPRRVGNVLFIHDRNGVANLESPAALFGWLARRCGIVSWRRGNGCVTKEEFHAELRRTATEYVAIEHLPHEPPVTGHYYACENTKPGDGSTLESFLDYFCPLTDIDRQLQKAAAITPIWGGPPGSRPAFLFTASTGRGRGKSTAAMLLAKVFWGYIDISANEDIGVIKQRLLSPDAARLRVALLDNVKSSRFSWAELESLITTSDVSGKRMYVGDARRPNLITWLITLNGASLSTDMSQRVVEIQFDEPLYTKTWEAEVNEFIESHRMEIIADMVGLLRKPPMKMRRHSRWATWEGQVLARMDCPDECLDVLLERRSACDVEQEESEVIEEYFASRLSGLGYNPDTEDVFIPTPITMQWFNAATGDRKKAVGVTRAIKQLQDEGRIWRLTYYRGGKGGERGTRWVGEHADASEPTQWDLAYRIAKRQESGESRGFA